jgi:hypothetical protein
MKYLKLLIALLVICSCSKDNYTLIDKNQIGVLTNTTKIKDVEKILVEDSIVISKARNTYGEVIALAEREIEVYDTSGLQALLIKPTAENDTLSLIKSIRVLSNKYKTKDEIGLGSTFAALKKHHKIGDIRSSLKSIIITLDDLNAFVSFDKEVLSGDIRFDMDAEIKSTMIPEDAKINRFWLNFETDANVEE